MSKTNYWIKFEESGIYHVYNRGIDKKSIFKTEAQYDFFLKKWKSLIAPFFEIYAYCLMPNHFHFLIQVKTLNTAIKDTIKKQGTSKSLKFIAKEISYNEFLEDQFKRMFSSYALTFNLQESRTGSLFQKRFKRVLIKSEPRLLYILAYIHHNPIHHGFSQDFEDWKYSSYSAFLNMNKSSLIARNNVFSYFDQNPEQGRDSFINYHKDFIINNKGEIDHLE